MENRTAKSIDVGGTSDAGDIPNIVEFLKIINPKAVLDIGTGCFGKNAYLIRQYVEHKYRHLYGTQYLTVDGVEAYKPNLDYVRTLGLYDSLYQQEALDFLNEYMHDIIQGIGRRRYDVVMCTHVLEHHIKEHGWLLLAAMYEVAKKAVILACPLGEYEHIDDHNEYQTHKSAWVPDEIARKYPITTPIMTMNNVGHQEFVIVMGKL